MNQITGSNIGFRSIFNEPQNDRCVNYPQTHPDQAQICIILFIHAMHSDSSVFKIVDNKIFESVTVSTNISNHALKRIEKHENMHKNNL